jgi:hypothetical protein
MSKTTSRSQRERGDSRHFRAAPAGVVGTGRVGDHANNRDDGRLPEKGTTVFVEGKNQKFVDDQKLSLICVITAGGCRYTSLRSAGKTLPANSDSSGFGRRIQLAARASNDWRSMLIMVRIVF